MGILLILALGISGCDSKSAAGGYGDAASRQEPAPKPTPAPPSVPPPDAGKPAPVTVPPAGQDPAGTPSKQLPGLPNLTGDKAADKKAVTSALEQLKKDWDANKKALDALMQGGTNTKPDPEKVKELRAKNDEFKARAEKLQELLDQIGRS